MKSSLVSGLVLSVLLGGCASFYDNVVSQPPVYHQPLVVVESYTISGRFSIKSAAKNDYGNFNWHHESANDLLEFRSPIGTTVAQIQVVNNIATLSTAGETYSGAGLEQLMQQQLGFSLPLNYLHYWIQGIPLPQYPLQQRLASGFRQLNWKIEYLSWQDVNHPQIVQLSNANLRIKLLINW